MGFTLLLSSADPYCFLPLLGTRSNIEVKLYPIVYRTDMFCNEKYCCRVIFTCRDPIVAFIFCCMCKGFKSIKNNTFKLQQVFNLRELWVCLLLHIKLYFGGEGCLWQKDKKQLKIIHYVSDSQSGDTFSPGSAVLNAALFGDACPYHPDSESGEGFFIPRGTLLYFV